MKQEVYNKKFYESRAYGKFNQANLQKSKNWFSGWLRFLDKFLNLKNGRGRKSLEVGCGFGAISNLLTERGFEAYASDVSPYAVEQAKKLSPAVRFFCFDVEKNIPLKEKFDFIFAVEVLGHLKNPQKAIRNMYQKLKHNGYLVCSTPQPYKHYVYSPKMLGHINVKNPKEWLVLFQKAGFKKQNLFFKPVSFLPFLYRFHQQFSLVIPFGLSWSFINSTVFYIARK